jgi:adenylate kinase
MFDGFPSSLQQAEALDFLFMTKGMDIDLVLEFVMPNEQMAESRVCGRRVHLKSGRNYHIESNKPRYENKDDVTGEPLYHDPKDTTEVFR